jgi:hypothetical protein
MCDVKIEEVGEDSIVKPSRSSLYFSYTETVELDEADYLLRLWIA